MKRAATAAPKAKPAMYAASTVATASSEVPNTVDNCRIQAVWYNSAANPDRKKQTLTATKTNESEGLSLFMTTF
jgi:hypothetical protein